MGPILSIDVACRPCINDRRLTTRVLFEDTQRYQWDHQIADQLSLKCAYPLFEKFGFIDEKLKGGNIC